MHILSNSISVLQELMSLAAQISCAYAANLRAPRPFQLYLTGLETGGRIHRTLHTRISDFSSYQACHNTHTVTADPLISMYTMIIM